jgi:hypothetical protein
MPAHRLALIAACLLPLTLAAGGCASYVVPGRAADLSVLGLSERERAELTESSIRDILDRRPLASFPVSVALVRVQCPEYRSATNEGWGVGNYSIVFERDVEKDEDVERLEKLPDVRGVAPLGRLLLPRHLSSNLELRKAAAALRADMVLLYTLDTTFHVEDHAKPLTVLSLGLLPSREAHVRCTASALLVDVRNGYLYGLAEATRKQDQSTNAWSSRSTVDRARRETETAAFEGLVDELEDAWGRLVEEAKNAPPPPPRRREEPRRLERRTGRWYPTDGG